MACGRASPPPPVSSTWFLMARFGGGWVNGNSVLEEDKPLRWPLDDPSSTEAGIATPLSLGIV